MCNPALAARRVLVRTEQSQCHPVSLSKICSLSGIEVREHDMSKLCGSSLMQMGKPYIFVASNLPKSRKRFTVAHELGHLFLRHDGICLHTSWKDDLKTEREANIFAGELLLPRGEFIKKVLSGKDIQDIAREYEVSSQVVEIHIRELKLRHGAGWNN